MTKITFQFLMIIALFLAVWYSISRVNWMGILKIEEISDATEKKLGDLYWDFFKRNQTEIKNDKIILPVDSLLSAICNANGIPREAIKLHILENSEINAFALPNKNLVIFTGLILASENEDELNGVISHELAHIQKNHVMKKLVKEIGLSAILSITTGNSSAEIVKETAKLLSSSAYDRNLEREADIQAVNYLSRAGRSSTPFANFLYRLDDYDGVDKMQSLTWFSTHPDAKERAEYILTYDTKKKKSSKATLHKETWSALIKNLEGY